jgi:hypothetical protein
VLLTVLQTANLAVRLAVELCALVAVAYWGFHLERPRTVRIVVGIGAPLALAVVWALFASPNTDIAVAGSVKVAIQLLVLGLATAALVRVGRTRLAVGFAGIAAANAALIALWGQ